MNTPYTVYRSTSIKFDSISDKVMLNLWKMNALVINWLKNTLAFLIQINALMLHVCMSIC